MSSEKEIQGLNKVNIDKPNLKNISFFFFVDKYINILT
jgi:hypothetical protein